MHISVESLTYRVFKSAKSVFRTRACDLLGCDFPIILAGMGGVARSELATAVSEAGGYGFLGMVRETPDFIRRQIGEVRAKTARNFGVNLIPAATPSDLFREEIRVCIEEKVHSVCFFWDVDPAAISMLRESGILVVCQVGSSVDARQALDAGAQMLIVQGIEAGGHVRSQKPLTSLLKPIIRISGDIPVLAAGGIASGQAFINILDHGASGVVLGTALLATDESFAHDYHKSRVVKETSDETILTDMFHINWPRGAAVRVLKNTVTQGRYGDHFTKSMEKIGDDSGRSIYRFSTDSPLRTTSGDLESMALYAGKSIDHIRNISSVEDRIREILWVALSLRSAQAEFVRVSQESLPPESSSSVCYADEGGNTYMGFLSRTEVANLLNVLLEAERAGARAAARLANDVVNPVTQSAMRELFDNEVFCCRLLLDELAFLGEMPSSRTGDFYGKLIEIEGNEARIEFLTKGQKWVARKLREALPKIRDGNLHKRLTEMLVLHEVPGPSQKT